tara:strand:+ start:2902 stop:3306 length:405 start_codon:yes stop_codon:yes gene_type:complete
MENNTRFYEIFNKKLQELLSDLIVVFPDDKDFKLFKNSVRLITLADVKKPLQMFKLSLTDEYKKNIEERNTDFFLDNDYSDVLNNDVIKQTMNDDDVNKKLINKLKGYWKDLNDNNRDTIWSYFNILLKLSNKI